MPNTRNAFQLHVACRYTGYTYIVVKWPVCPHGVVRCPIVSDLGGPLEDGMEEAEHNHQQHALFVEIPVAAAVSMMLDTLIASFTISG